MSKKKDRSWFVCPQWAELVSGHYASDAEAARALKTDPKVLGEAPISHASRQIDIAPGLASLANRHNVGSPIADLVIDARSR